LERKESLEQLRVLDNGYSIKTVEIYDSSLSVDVPQDIIKVEQRMKNQMEKNG
jgi:3-deoxy-manno-octulosonate cytidylyltransferase (CMP-KDO synthetase)